jgi:hypothetical protein
MVPLNDSFSMSNFADLCGRSGLGTGPGGRGCNFFQPATSLTGIAPTYVQYDNGSPGYDTDYNNFAPNVGAAWRPNVQDGWLRKLLGDPDQATVRAGFSLAYTRERMDRFTNVYSANPGAAINANRSGNQSNLVLTGENWPITITQPGRLGAPALPERPAYPLSPSLVNGDDINVFDPSIQVPSTRSWSVGFQRALSKDMAIDIRYVGTRLRNGWTTENWNEINIVENGFLEEFKLAQANLRAHVAQGCGTTVNPCSFAYRGAGTGTSPLPTYLAYFARVPASRAGNAAEYAGVAQFTNSAWTGHLGQHEPDPLDAGNDLHANATFRANALAAGVPANFFVLNPDVDQANIVVGATRTKYDALQLDFRRRLSRGLNVSANYVFSRTYESDLDTVRRDRVLVVNDDGVPHAFKTTWYYEVPFGHGKRFGGGVNKWVNGVIGNWEVSGTGRVQVRDFRIDDPSRLVGMTPDELMAAFKPQIVRDASGTVTVWSLPQDIIDNTRRAWNTDPTSQSGYSSEGAPTGRYIAPASQPGCIAVYQGDCGTPHNIFARGPIFTRFDLSFKKRFPFGRGATFDLQLDLLNAFDNVNFNPTFDPTPAAGTTAWQITSGYTDINTTFDPGGRIGQIVWRVNW